jgi:hypothetical protein
MKVTEPVGTVVLPAGPATLAVNVTDCPLAEGFTDDVSVVVVAVAVLCVAVPCI